MESVLRYVHSPFLFYKYEANAKVDVGGTGGVVGRTAVGADRSERRRIDNVIEL